MRAATLCFTMACDPNTHKKSFADAMEKLQRALVMLASIG
jgi:hypothetical protein